MDRNKSISTKRQMLLVIDDIDLIVRQLFETLAQQSASNESTAMDTTSNSFKMDPGQLTDLLIQKNKSLIKLTETAREQQKLQQQIEIVQAEITHHDELIDSLQKHLKQSEHLLASALYQAKEQLKLFNEANKRPVMSEDVIRYAHQISACCSTAAPLNWTPGDPRRPYPQDIQMRCGMLGQISSLAVENDMKPPALLGTEGIQMPKSDIRWQQSSDLSSFNSLKTNDEVDVMSSDSSTSDSSDSSIGND